MNELELESEVIYELVTLFLYLVGTVVMMDNSQLKKEDLCIIYV